MAITVPCDLISWYLSNFTFHSSHSLCTSHPGIFAFPWADTSFCHMTFVFVISTAPNFFFSLNMVHFIYFCFVNAALSQRTFLTTHLKQSPENGAGERQSYFPTGEDTPHHGGPDEEAWRLTGDKRKEQGNYGFLGKEQMKQTKQN